MPIRNEDMPCGCVTYILVIGFLMLLSAIFL